MCITLKNSVNCGHWKKCFGVVAMRTKKFTVEILVTGHVPIK
mgnify:CR=1 FL=1